MESATGPVMKAAMVLYVIPLVLFFLGYWLGDLWFGMGALVASAGFVLGIVLAVVYDRKVARKETIIYTITGFAGDALLESRKKGDNNRD